MQKTVMLLAAMMLCGATFTSQALEKLPGGEPGGAGPTGGGAPVTTTPTQGPTNPGTPTKTTVESGCAIACHADLGCGASPPAGDPTITAINSSQAQTGGTDVPNGAPGGAGYTGSSSSSGGTGSIGGTGGGGTEGIVATGGSGTGLQPGACKEYQQCMQQCIDSHVH